MSNNITMRDDPPVCSECAKLEADLAAARALLREAITHVNCHAFSSADRLAERIDAFLAGDGRT